MAGFTIVGDPNRKYQLQQQQIDIARSEADAKNNMLRQQTLQMPDITSADIMAKHAQAAGAFAQANLSRVNASLAPDVAKSEIGLRGAQGNAANAGADLTRTNAQLAPGLAASEIGMRASQGGAADASASLSRIQGMGLQDDMSPMSPTARGYLINRLNPGWNTSLTPTTGGLPAGAKFDPMTGRPLQGNAAGNSDVQQAGAQVAGPGDGTQDTVDTKVAPGEAIINKAGADFLGRDFIDKINQAGAIAMGLSQKPNEPTLQQKGVPGKPATEPQQGFAAGSKSVSKGKGKPGKPPSQPGGSKGASAKPAGGPAGKKSGDQTALIHAIASMMGGGGGMGMQPPGGAPQPQMPPM